MIPEPPPTPRILLVDDEIPQLLLRAQVMSLRGFPVLTADNPSDAIFMMAEEALEKVELVVLDYNMPGMNGCDLADLLKMMRPELKIILYSGATDVPRNEMTSIDTFVSKADGISALIAEVAELTQVGRGSPTTITGKTEQHSRSHPQQY
ncbi:MAG: response regulator receiver protein [Candidatus Angelobacter sp.]|nr:response regulator receiver protein [Candidatus Angelobacter sp.]